MIRYLLHILAVAAIIVTLSSCEDEGYLNSPDVQLHFSADTIMFDTVFTTIGSTTQNMRVYNPYNESLLISRISLGGGDFSNFRLNINGEVTNVAYDVEIPPNDSIFIFVEVTVDPNGQTLPMVVQDSIEFLINNNIQHVNLIAYGQDFKLIRAETIRTTTWTAEKPYLVYDYAYVDSTHTLTIEPGTRIYFHKGAGLYVKGTVIANGTFQNQIQFMSDRLEESYEDVPDQWNGILLFSGSNGNIFNHTTIKNANIGLQVGNIENEGSASVQLSNSVIKNMAYAGIFALKSEIYAFNNVVANCGFYAVALLIGGNYEFYHSTIANYWGNFGSRARSTASLVISNSLVIEQSDGSEVTYTGDLENALFANSIIYGNNAREIELGNNGENEFDFLFDHCIIQVPDTFNVSDNSHFKNVWKGNKFDPKFVDPYDEYIFELDTLSPAKDSGKEEYAKMFPLDILNHDRTADEGPDLGAFERIEKKDED